MNRQIRAFENTDVLVIGGGLAGIVASYGAKQQGLKVTMVVAERLCSGSSFYPYMEMLGCQCTSDREGDLEDFITEMNESGAGMNDENLCRIYAEKINGAVKKLPMIGIEYKKFKSNKVACFAQRVRDIYCWGSWDKIRANLYGIFAQNKINVIENTTVIKICKKENRVIGALCCDKKNTLSFIKANAIILATGGFGDLYKHNQNTGEINGSGHVLALNAGARLINMEFIQFMQGVLDPIYKLDFREDCLIYCKEIKDDKGNNLLSRYFDNSDDIKKCLKERSTYGPFSTSKFSKYFDIAVMKEIQTQNPVKGIKVNFEKEILKDERDSVVSYVKWLKEDLNISVSDIDIYIAPFCQASNGGVWINAKCETGVPGLFAVGESAGGISGADRHGGNATGSCLVFGEIAASNAARYVNEISDIQISDDEVKALLDNIVSKNDSESINPIEIITQVREILWKYCNIIRDEKGLSTALDQILALKKNYNAFQEIENGKDILTAINAENYIEMAEILLRVMLERKESRGAHYREDYPLRDDEKFNKRIAVSKSGNDNIRIDFVEKGAIPR